MTNPKIEKVKTEMEKTKAKIAELQAKYRDLEREKIRLENEDIVALVRSERISDAELSALMRSLRKEEPTAEAAAPARITDKEESYRANDEEN
jgi:hypothetical protein